MNTPPTRRVEDVIQALCLVAGTADAEKVLSWLSSALEQQPLRGDERAEDGRFLQEVLENGLRHLEPGQHEIHDEDRARWADLSQAAYLLAKHSQRPLSVIAQLSSEAHSSWLCSVITALCEREEEGDIDRLPNGECILHQLCTHENSGLEFFLRLFPEMKLHPDWFACIRTTDGATPLHVLWSLTEGGPFRVNDARVNGGSMQWMAYEHHSNTVRETKVFMDRGADLMSKDHAGNTVLDLMIQARAQGFWEWMHNEAGIEWIVPVLRDYERVMIDRATLSAAAVLAPPRL